MDNLAPLEETKIMANDQVNYPFANSSHLRAVRYTFPLLGKERTMQAALSEQLHSVMISQITSYSH